MKIRLISILLILSFTACSSLNKLSLYNLSGQYDNTLFTRLDAVAFNTDDQSVSVFVPILMSDMVSAFDENTGKTHRDALLRYEMFENYDSKQILDSAGILITDSNLMLIDTMISFKIRYPSSNKFILKLELVDLNRVDVVRNYLWLDNSSPASSDHY